MNNFFEFILINDRFSIKLLLSSVFLIKDESLKICWINRCLLFSWIDEFDNIIGLSYLKCLHINDSKNIISSHKDRHDNIGYGTIGFDNLINIIYNERVKNLPKILETPYYNDLAPYKEEIKMLRERKFNDFRGSENNG